jgi:hypothetical protein
MARLHHPNVVTIFDIGTVDPGVGEELPYLVMEFVRGRSLNVILEDGPLPPRRAARVIEQVALALSAAHQAGVIHRDLKPSNIMVSDKGHVTVLDFGLARLADREGETPVESLTTPGMVLGSCPYMAPEQALGRGVTPASDVFSCGSVLYETISGQRAFDGPTPMKVLEKVVRAEYTPLHEVVPDAPDDIVAVAERCLQRDAENRYETAEDLAQDLAIFQGTDDDSLAEAPTVAISSSKMQAVAVRRRRSIRRALAVAAGMLAAGLALGLVAGRWGQEARKPDPGAWQVRPLVDTVGTLTDPDWSPDGSQVVVARYLSGAGDVLAVVPETGEARTLVRAGPSEAFSLPRFSPDGKALLVEVIVAGEPSLRVVPAVGGQVTTEVVNAGGGSWLDPDSFVFSREDDDGLFSLYRYSISRREAVRVRGAENGRSWWAAKPRPGGGFALLSGPAGIPDGLFIASELDSAAEPWLASGEQIYGLSWLPHGRSLVASVDGRLVRVSDAGVDSLLPRIDRLWDPAVSPQGDRMAIIRRNATNDLVAVDPNDGGWSCLLCGVTNSGWGSVGVDGAIAYRRYVGGRGVLFLRDASGGEIPISDGSEDAACPSISPNGELVAYLAQPPGSGTELRVVSRSGGRPVTLATDVEPSEYPSWSPDGRFLAYAAGSPISVWVVSAAGGEPRKLTPDGGDYPRWSPDGRWIAYSVWTQDSDPDQGAWVVPADAGTALKIGDQPTRLVWSPDGEWLWQLRRAGETVELWQAEVDGWSWQRRTRIDVGGTPSSHLEYLPLTVNPSTGDLVINRRTTFSGLVLLEGLDPAHW